MTQQMAIWGIGLKFALFSLLYFICALIVHFVFYPFFVIEKIPYTLLVAAGIVLIGIGIPIWIISVKAVVKGFSEGILVTEGIYAICRHPLYGQAIFYTFPGLLMFFKSYILFTLPLFMYFLFRILISAEEKYLQEKFGNAFVDYMNSVNMSFPKFWKMFK
ncbi:MAG: isoprenylcysteine carboxylmethyltransferase family protein [Deltaproteobacteria bacterium]|nr:isoprenylcysteine carboxylmethyltransferase family protein [Deltaproteobacteria bacterium]